MRDALLGLPVADRDWVVVGETPESMRAAGFKPVGRDFPVFLHPQTHEEYALARTERKSGRGYHGFTVHASPEVTLEDDLRRRDLTINAMARDAAGSLIDPHGGEKDLRDGVLRHVGEAFAEDPVRILRVARFAARFRFRVAEETAKMLRRMVESGAAGQLVAERVWQELARGLLEPHPAAMLQVLENCAMLGAILPGIAIDARLCDSLARAVTENAPLEVRFAVLAWRLPEPELIAICERLRVPNEARDLALASVRNAAALREGGNAGAAALLALLKRTDAFRRPERLGALLAVARLAEPAPAILHGAGRLALALTAAAAVDAGEIARAAPSQAEIPERIDRAREAAIAAALSQPGT